MSLSQVDYVKYMRCLSDIKVIEQCCRKNELSRIGFSQGRFVKLPETPLKNFNTIFEKLSSSELKDLSHKIAFINAIHNKLKEGSQGECAPLAAEAYNTHLKTITTWNNLFQKPDLLINLPAKEGIQLDFSLLEKTSAQIADEKAITRYFELLKKYPKLKREGEMNDYKKGAYQIIYDPKEIASVQKEIFQRLYKKGTEQGLSHLDAEELASSFSRPGIVCEDQFWLWIRDVVISPQNYKHTYNRLVWKCDLERTGGVAALPILVEEGKIVVQVAFRHATSSFEIEMPRGGSKEHETPMMAAKREVLEETGRETDDLDLLGSITPDSGVLASIVPIFLGKVVMEKERKKEKTEAIKGTYAFTYMELLEGFKRGYMEVEINEKMTQVYMRDPFLAFALLMAQHNKHL